MHTTQSTNIIRNVGCTISSIGSWNRCHDRCFHRLRLLNTRAMAQHPVLVSMKHQALFLKHCLVAILSSSSAFELLYDMYVIDFHSTKLLFLLFYHLTFLYHCPSKETTNFFALTPMAKRSQAICTSFNP